MSPTPARCRAPDALCLCPSCAAVQAVALLTSGRAARALQLLEGLPASIDRWLDNAREDGLRSADGDMALRLSAARLEAHRLEDEARELREEVERRRRELATLDAALAAKRATLARVEHRAANPRPAPALPKRLQDRLGEALRTGWVTPQRGGGLLKVRPCDLPGIVAGRARLAPSAWLRLVRELGL